MACARELEKTDFYAKGGATIADIERLVKDSNEKSPEFVILQAWTKTARKSLKRLSEWQDASLRWHSPHSLMQNSFCQEFFQDSETMKQIKLQNNESFRYNCKRSQHVKFIDGYLHEDLYWDDAHLNNKGLSRIVTNLRKSISNWSKNSRWLKEQPKTCITNEAT